MNLVSAASGRPGRSDRPLAALTKALAAHTDLADLLRGLREHLERTDSIDTDSPLAALSTPDGPEFMAQIARLVGEAAENALRLAAMRQENGALQLERDQLNLLLDVTNAVVT